MSGLVFSLQERLKQLLRTSRDQPIALCATGFTLVASLLAWPYIQEDYRRFLSLGAGGIPNNAIGYLYATFLRLFYAHRDPFRPPTLRGPIYPRDSYLQSRPIPRRSLPRPVTDGIAPHRQLTQHASLDLHTRIREALLLFAVDHLDVMTTGISAFEKYGLALFMKPGTASKDPEAPQHAATSQLNPTCRDTGEITHLHDSDSSMHVTLHPLDAAIVIALGWGQRHPMAGNRVLGRQLVPDGFTMVYAPSNFEEVDVTMQIVKAGAWWVGGLDLS